MELDGQTNPETENVNIMPEATDAVETPPESIEQPPEGTEPESVVPESGEGDAQYEADFKFKYFGNEAELDDKLRAFIQDKESEETLKELARKAKSFDYLRETSKIEDFKGDSFKELLQSNARIQEHYAPLEESYNKVVSRVTELDHFVKAQDYGSFFDNLNIKKEDIIKWAANELAYQEAPPEQRQQLDMQRNMATQQANLEYQNQVYQSQIAQHAVQTRTMEVNNEMAKPEVSEFVQKFDSLRGPGSFFNEVKEAGIQEWSIRQVDLPAGEAVRRVMEKYSAFFPQQQEQSPTQPQSTSRTVVQPNTAKATIPNIKAGGRSPVKHRVNSLDDIRKIRQEMENNY